MAFIHRATHVPSSVQKYSVMSPAPACCAGSGLQTALTTFSSPEDGLSVHLLTLHTPPANSGKTFTFFFSSGEIWNDY